MKDRVNVPGRGEVKLGSHGGDEFRNEEGSISFRGQFDCSVGYGKVLFFQPDTLSLGIFAGKWRMSGRRFIQG
jgi:hypothetical protein